mgnify:FL=1
MQINSSRSNGYNVSEAGITGIQNHTVTGQSEESCNYSKILEEKREELWTKIMNGQTETTYQIGGQSFTEKEWERLLKRVDTEIETEEDEKENSEDKSSVEPYAALIAEITDKEQFLGEQLSKVEQRAEELKKIKKGIYEMQAMIEGQSMETLIEDQEKAEEKRTEEKKQEKTNAQELGKQDKKITNREEIMEMMMAGTRPVL